MKEVKCERCGKPMLGESVSPETFRYWCRRCGVSEVRDTQGRKLILGAVSYSGKQPLMG